MLPELVAAVAAATEAEVFAALLAGLNALAHVREQLPELFGPRGGFQGHIPQIPQVEAAVAVAGHGEQLGVKGGEIPLPIDTQNREGSVQLVLGHPLATLDQADHLLELPQHNGMPVLFAETPERAQEIAVFALHGRSLHRGAGVNPLLLLHVEADIVDAVVPEEAVHPLGLFHRVFRQDGDAVEGNLIAMQGFDPLHRLGVGSTTVAEATVGVMNLLRTIDADAHHDAIAPEAVAPGVIDQGGVGLNVLMEIQALGAMVRQAAMQTSGGLVVPAGRQRQRLSRMPDQRKLGPGIGALENPLD